MDPEKLIEAVTALCEGLRSDMTKLCDSVNQKYDSVADALKKKKDSDDDTMAEQTAADGRRADAVTRGELEVVRAQLRDLQTSQPRKRTDADRNAFADMQAKADVAHRALGGQADAPMAGEELADYAIRLHRPLLKHSKKWGKADLFALSRDPSTMHSVLDQVRADAVAASMSPEGMPEFVHREVKSESPGGHKITTFVGTGSIYKQLSRRPKYVTSIGGDYRYGRSAGGSFIAKGAEH